MACPPACGQPGAGPARLPAARIDRGRLPACRPARGRTCPPIAARGQTPPLGPEQGRSDRVRTTGRAPVRRKGKIRKASSKNNNFQFESELKFAYKFEFEFKSEFTFPFFLKLEVVFEVAFEKEFEFEWASSTHRPALLLSSVKEAHIQLSQHTKLHSLN